MCQDRLEAMKLDAAFGDMGFQPHFDEHPLFTTSDIIRYRGVLGNRLRNTLGSHDLSPESEAHLRDLTERYRTILERETARRDNEKNEGIYVFALQEACAAASMSDGHYSPDQLTPEQEASLTACIAKVVKVSWADYLEAMLAPDNVGDAVDSVTDSAVVGAVSSATAVAEISGKFILDLNAAYFETLTPRRARRLAAHPPTASQWVGILRMFWLEIKSAKFEIKTNPQGAKTVVFPGKASLRSYLTKQRYGYSKDKFAVLDAVNSRPTMGEAGRNALKGGANRFFIVVAGVMEVNAWLESEEEDWYDLIARLGLVLLAAVLTAMVHHRG